MMESQDRTKVWFVVALCLLVLVGGYFFTEWLIGGREVFRGAAPEQPAVPLIAPVAQPDIEDFEDVAQYTGGKPLPVDPGYEIFLTDVETDEHIRGDRATKVTVVQYAALSSLYTQLVYPQMAQFFEKNKDRVHWVFRHYPGSENENDYRAAQATECITEQLGNDGFWAYMDLLMPNRGSPLPIDLLLSSATKIGADSARLRACVEGEELYDYVLQDKQNALSDAKIYVTPTFVFLNNETRSMRIVEGLNTLEYMQAVLDDVAK
ncbi:MAG: thioredoxin domain-containing protein [Candidatus Peribacteraceae bacterium]|nr:thioredoxin domain-containing protein [Candidatus Peribacteraceae bacterium]